MINIYIYSTTISETGNTETIGFSIEKQGTNPGWFGVHTFQSIYLAVARLTLLVNLQEVQLC